MEPNADYFEREIRLHLQSSIPEIKTDEIAWLTLDQCMVNMIHAVHETYRASYGLERVGEYSLKHPESKLDRLRGIVPFLTEEAKKLWLAAERFNKASRHYRKQIVQTYEGVE